MLDDLGVPWLVGGSIASSLQGVPRATQDVDLVAALQRMHTRPFSEALEERFYVSEDAIWDAIRRRWFFKLEDGSQLPLASAEDIILQKLDWYRKGGQTFERQLRDVLGVLQVQGKDLDFVYLEDMAAQSGLSELLKKALGLRSQP